MHRRTFGESADKLIEEFLCAYLEVEGVAAILDTYVQELSKGELCEAARPERRHAALVGDFAERVSLVHEL